MAVFSLQALHDEIENDPKSLGYKTGSEWKEDNVICDLINAKNYKIDSPYVPMETIRKETKYQWYNTLTADEQEYLKWITPNGGNTQITADVKLQLSGRTMCSEGVAGTGSNNDSWWSLGTRNEAAPAMLALIELDGSRSEVLWNENKIVTISEVGHAANL